MTAKYVLFKGQDSQFYFTLRAANAQPILQSEGYYTKDGAKNGIASCKANSPFDVRYSREGYGQSLWFTLKGANGEKIGRSETYTSSQARETGISSVKLNGPGAPTEDLT